MTVKGAAVLVSPTYDQDDKGWHMYSYFFTVQTEFNVSHELLAVGTATKSDISERSRFPKARKPSLAPVMNRSRERRGWGVHLLTSTFNTAQGNNLQRLLLKRWE